MHHQSTTHVVVVCLVDQVREEVRELRARNQRLRFLAQFSRKLLAVTTHQEFVRHVFEPLSEHLELEVYINFIISEDGGHLVLDSCSGLPEEAVEQLRRIEFGSAVCGTVAARACPIIAEGVQQRSDEMTQLIRDLGIAAYACHPLTADGRLIGTLSFGSRKRERFESDEIELMRAACDHVAVAIERTRLLDALRERNQRLDEADQRKNRFLAMLAHELRNPMAPILTASTILEQDVDEEVAARARSIIRGQAQHMARLVDDLLDVSRITRGRILVREEKVDLMEVVDAAVQVCSHSVAERGQKLEVETDGPLEVVGDRARLEQILVNLLTNASKYTPRGGLIRVGLRAEGGQAVLTVTDDGIGMSPEELEHVFDMFYQADDTADRSRGGLGVGLTLVRSLTELHGGRVIGRSDGPDQGSVFEVRIPLAVSTGRSMPVHHEELDGDLSGRSILVVEDNRESAEMLRMLLEILGAQVVVAHDGPRGIELGARTRPDVAIIDLGLPGMDGVETGRRLRNEVEGVTLVALSGYATKEDRARTLAAGFTDHLAKPADAETLKRTLLKVGTSRDQPA